MHAWPARWGMGALASRSAQHLKAEVCTFRRSESYPNGIWTLRLNNNIFKGTKGLFFFLSRLFWNVFHSPFLLAPLAHRGMRNPIPALLWLFEKGEQAAFSQADRNVNSAVTVCHESDSRSGEMIPDWDPHIKCINLRLIHLFIGKKPTKMVEESQLFFIHLLLGFYDWKREKFNSTGICTVYSACTLPVMQMGIWWRRREGLPEGTSTFGEWRCVSLSGW